MAVDLYEVLGVTRGANHERIRHAYRKLARRYHPDVNPDEGERFKEITVAYGVLGDAQRRGLYDEFGEASLKPGFDAVVARQQNLGYGAGENPTGAFEAFYGGGHTTAGTRPYQGSPRQGGDYGSNGRPSGFEDVPFGWGGGFATSAGTRPYEGSAPDDDDESASSTLPNEPQPGVNFGFESTSTEPLEGEGGLHHHKLSGNPGGASPGLNQPRMSNMPLRGSDIQVHVTVALLESLRGTSRDVTIQRKNKHGAVERERVRVSLKAGVQDGEQYLMTGKGNAGQHGGPSGDLTVLIHVQSTAHFRREGYDLYIEVPISLQEALSGGKIEVPTPDGRVVVTVPPNSIQSPRLRLKRRGVSVGNGQRGDLYLILCPVLPESCEDVQRLIGELEQHYPSGGVRRDFKL